MAELSAVNVVITGDSSGLKAAATSAAGAVDKIGGASQAAATKMAREMEKSARAVDRLKQSIDPVYAATKRIEAATQTLNIALKNGQITQAQYAASLQQVQQRYAAVERASLRQEKSFATLLGSSRNMRFGFRTLGTQAQGLAMQFGATAGATGAFASQFAMMASAFGPWGIAVGVVASVGLPLLALAFGKTKKAAAEVTRELTAQEEAINRLIERTRELRAEGDVKRLGVSDDELSVALELNRIADLRMTLMRDMVAENSRLNAAEKEGAAVDATRLNALSRRVVMLDKESAALKAQLESYRMARDYVARQTAEHERQVALGEKLAKTAGEFLAIQGKVVTAVSVIAGMDMSGPFAAAESHARRLLGAVNETSAALLLMSRRALTAGLSDDRRESILEHRSGVEDARGVTRDRVQSAWLNPQDGGGGGGGGGANPVVAELAALQNSLMTQEQLQIESFTRQQETLRAALEQRLIMQQEFAALMEQTQQQHADKMQAIDGARYGTALGKASAFFGAFGAISEKALKVSQAFAAADAWISTLQGAARELRHGTFGFASAMAVIAKGAAFVAAIKGVSPKGGGGSVGSASGGATAAPPPMTQNLLIDVRGSDAARITARTIIDQINAAVKQGYRVDPRLVGG